MFSYYITTVNNLASGTYYVPPYSSDFSDSTLERCEVVVTHAMTLDKLYYKQTNAFTTDNMVITVMKNGAATSLTCTLSSGAGTEASDTSNSVTFAAGDLLSFRAVHNVGSNSTGRAYITARQQSTSGNLFNFSNSRYFPSSSATQYVNLMGYSYTNATYAFRHSVIPVAGTIKNLYVDGVDPTAGKTQTFTLYKNGSSTALTCTLTAGNTTASDTSNSVSVAAGDTIALQNAPSGTPTTGFTAVGLSFEPTTTSDYFVMQSLSDYSATATRYVNPVGSADTSGATDTSERAYFPTSVIKSVALETTALGVGKTLDLTVQVNSSDTDVTASLTGTATSTTGTGFQSLAYYDYASIKVVPTGTPAANNAFYGVGLSSTVDLNAIMTGLDNSGNNALGSVAGSQSDAAMTGFSNAASEGGGGGGLANGDVLKGGNGKNYRVVNADTNTITEIWHL